MANNAQKLQEGRIKAKALFSANCLKELTINHGNKIIRLFHPDIYNFQILINDKGSYFYGSLGEAIRKLYIILNNKDEVERIENWLVSINCWDIKSDEPCSFIDIKSIKEALITGDLG